MKRRVLSLIISLALCLNLCPIWVLAVDEGTDSGLCPHHQAHTDECGYAPGDSGAPCTFVCDACRANDSNGEQPDSAAPDDTPDSDEASDIPNAVAVADEPAEDETAEDETAESESAEDEPAEDDPAENETVGDGQDQTDETDDGTQTGSDINDFTAVFNENKTDSREVTTWAVYNMNGYTLMVESSTAIKVTGTGNLQIMGGGEITSQDGAGIEVASGGSLSIENTEVTGSTYALDIASGANVHLSGGTFSGRTAAIRIQGGDAADYAALLESGCAFFDAAGKPISPANAIQATKLTIGQCTDHLYEYTHTSGTTEHTWTCPYCGTTETEKCTVTFGDDGTGNCDFCENGITIAVNESDLAGLVYDGTVKPQDVRITVTLTDGSGKELVKGTDYKVDHKPKKDAGEDTITVTGITFNGTFIKTYHVEQAQPGISWSSTTATLNYDGGPVEAGDLPSVNITIPASEDLHPYLQYSYRKTGETEFTDGLPTNAGTYEVKAYIPESQNYKEAETGLLTLTIRKISAVATAPTAKTLTYNREAQELVTACVLKPGAIAEGAKIEYKLGTDGTYSENIPTGITVTSYNVYYQVSGTGNYTGVSETLIPNPNTQYTSARINHKEITPTVELEYYTTLYTGGDKEPKVTVKDGEYVIPNSEYAVVYSNNKNVGDATVTVNNAGGGNYKLTTATATFKITLLTQATLSITQKPATVIYGDTFTLGTQGGSGNGHVTWAVVSGPATVNTTSGQVKVTGHGTITVKATKSGTDPDTNQKNYEDATAAWEFEAALRPVVATVTADDKTYNGNKDAIVHAVVEQGVLPGDEITITGLTGTFNDENAGTNKTVTVNKDNAEITGNNSEHYAVSYSSLSVKATITKAVAKITTAPVPATLTYTGEAQALLDNSGVAVDPSSVLVEYALSESGLYATTIPTGTNTGKYTVWYRVQETDNYTGLAPDSVDVTIAPKPVTPTVTLDPTSYVFDGTEKKPTVTVKDGEDTIPESNYTVTYSNNVNVGTAATVTVTAKTDGNYTFTDVTENFTITKEPARVITAPKEAGDPLTFNNRAQKLVTAGTGYGGKMVYSLDNTTFKEDLPTGTDAKDYTVYYKVKGDDNHSDSEVGHVTVTIAPKTVNPATIELLDGTNPLVSYTYDGTAKKPTAVVKDGSTVIDADEYNVIYRDNVDAGRATVEITDKPGGNYTVTGSAPFVIVKADIVDPAPSAADITYDGKPHELLVAGTTSGGEVLYALNSATSTYTAAIPTGTQAGDYTVYYKVTGDKNHNDLAVQSVPVTIQRKPLTAITIELSPEGFAYDGSAKLPAVTVKDGKTVLPEEEYTWSCDVESPTNVGTYTITVSDVAGGNYDLTGVTANTATFTIGQVSQEALVIGGKPTTINYGDSFPLTVTGGSGTGAVSWNTTGPAAVDASGNVTITDVGTVTVTVEKAADTNYLAAEAQWTFTAAPKPVTAAVTVNNKPYDGKTSATVATATIPTINSDDVTIDPASITASFDTPAAGTGKTVTLETTKVKVDGADAGKYAISYPTTATADISQETTSITKAPAGITPLTYNGQPQALVTAGETNVGFIVYSLNGTNFSPEIPTGTDAKTYTVHYKVVETDDYTGAAGGTVTVTIAPKNITPTIELSQTSYLYDGTKKDPKITVKDGTTVIDADQYTVTWAGTKNQTDAEMLTVADTYTATIANVTNGNYTFSETATVEIVAATQNALKITGKPSHVYYGDTVTTLEADGGSGNGTVKWTLTGGTNSTINAATGELTIKDTGSITVKAERTVPNYAAVSDTWTFTVEPKPVTAEVVIADKTYDGSNSATVISVGVKASDLVNTGDSITISGLTATFDNANAGTNKTVTLDRSDPGFTIACDAAKYAVTIPAIAKADIEPREVTVTVTLSDHDLKTGDDGKYYYTYDGTEKRPAAAVTGSDDTGYSKTLAATDYTVDYANNKKAGNATVIVTASAGGNYTFNAKTVNFEIRNAAAVLTTTPQAKALTYDGTAQDLVTVGGATGGTVKYSSTGAAGSYSETIPQGTDAGTYTVYYMVEGDDNHDDTAPGQVSVTIKPKEITPKITLSQDTYTYDGNECKPTVTIEDGSDTITATEYDVSYRDNTNAGTATVIVSNSNGGNYIVNGTATFEITKAASTFTTEPTGKTGLQYNGSAQVLVTAGGSSHGTVVYSVNGGNWSTAIPTATAVGTYTVSYKIEGDQNHSDTTPATLTVEIAKNTVNTPTITLSSNQFTFNGSQQKPAVAVYDDNGLPIPEHEYSVAITPTTGGDAGIVNVGTYTVTVTTPANSNYVITTGNTRTFEIVPANQETISITGTQAQVRYGDTIQLGITGGTGSGTVTWTVTGTDASGNAAKSTISATGLLTVKDVGGPVKVTVTRSAGGNYSDVSATWEFSAAKKPVTAVVTVADKPYDGNNTATITSVEVNDRDLVTGDTLTINTTGLIATFDNENVGQNKTVKITGGPITDARYDITIPATTTASITAVAATVDADPTPNALTYDASQAQELVTAGTVTGGIMVYSLDGSNFTPSIPKAKDAGTYTVWFKVQGDGNHTDSAVKFIQVTIGKQSVAPQIELTPSGAQYDGKEHKPTVTLRDDDNNVIPTSEYKVTYVTANGEDWTKTGTYTVKIEDISGGNYIVDDATETFTISATAQNPLEITNKPGLVYYGDTFTLSAVGGSGSEAVTWSVDDAGKSVVEIDANGFVKIIGTGPATITATKPGGANYEAATAAYPLNALAKPITAIVTAEDKVFDNSDSATVNIRWKDGDLVGDDTITGTLAGKFDDANVGQNKKVTITGSLSNDNYIITIPASTTASILKADTTAPAVTANALTYNGSAQALVSGGNANTTVYSSTRDGVYAETVPTGTNAGTYTVWYKELGDANHNDSASQSVTVTIDRKTLGPVNITLSGNDLKTADDGTYSYVYDGSDKEPAVTVKDGEKVVPASEYTVSYSDNKNAGTATVTITSSEGGNYTFAEQTVNFTITSAPAQLTSSPQAKDLTYTGKAQELVTVGTATGGHIEYLQDDGTTYSTDIPKGTGAGTYTVTYKVVGDGGNYADSAGTWTVSVTIKPKQIVSPKVTVTGDYTYDGTAKEPAVADIKVEDGATVIPAGEYTVSFRDNVNAGTATAVITNANGGNYIVNGTGTFQIGKAAASVDTAPTGKENLPYNGSAQALAAAGKASGGMMVYALSETGEYSPVIPTGKDVDSYTVWYKVQGDNNHNDTAAQSVAASIIVNTVTAPTVQVTPGTVTWTGEKQEPTVTVRDDSGLLIDGSEYTAVFTMSDGNTDLTKVGIYNLTITATGSNYDFSGAAVTETFEILPADQTPLTITGTRERVSYGDTIQLGTTGGSGTISWKVGDGEPASVDSNGLLTITGVGPVKVTATSSAAGHKDQTATWSFVAEKKPVTANVTAEAKTYDGNKTATVTASLQSSDLVSGDTVKIKLSGSFEDPNAGTDKKVNVDSTNPDFTGSTGNYGNYSITYPATTTASIFKAEIDATKVTAPTAKSGLEYTGLAQALVNAGSSTEGTLEYSTDNIIYSAALPTGTGADSYDVWYRVKGDGNHNDTAGTKLGSVTIAPQDVTAPTIELTPTGASYDGGVHKPTVVVKDKNSRVIPDSEYTVTYDTTTDWTKVGKHKVTIKDETGGNYNITEKEAEFEISMMGQSPLTITNQPGVVHYGDTFTLSTTGGSGTGAVSWQSASPEIASIDSQSGLVKVHKSGSVKIIATKATDTNYGSTTAEWTFSAEKKPVKAIVTAKDKVFDGKDEATLVITWKDGDLLGNDEITLNLTGKFDDANVGTNKTVNISAVTTPTSDKYEISYNTTTTASITPAAATVTAPTPKTLEYTGQPLELVNAGTVTNGTVKYSLDGIVYGPNIPKGTNAGSYTVWYKVEGSENYKDVAPEVLPVTIAPKTVTNPTIELSPESFDYDGTAKKPDVTVKDGSIVIPESEYTVRYTNNTNAGTATVTINNVSGGNYVVSGSATFTIKAGTATLTAAPQERELVYTGRAQALVTPGTAVNGHLEYSSDGVNYSMTIPKGTDVDEYFVYYKVVGDNGYGDTAPQVLIVTIEPKQVTPTIKVGGVSSYSTPYTGNPVEPSVTVAVDGKTLTEWTDYYVVGYSDNTNPGTATVTVASTSDGNYQFYTDAAFTITKVKATFLMEPEAKTNLVYTGEAQDLVEWGVANDGATVVYSLNGGTFYPFVPTATEIGNYVVSAKVQGNDLYADSDVSSYRVSIGRNTIAEDKLNVTLSANSLKYTGSELKPTVTVRDGEGNIISASEYSVSYSNNINVGQASVTVTSTTKNYSFSKTVPFTITAADAPALTITGKPAGTVYYGDTLRLGTTGGSGAVTWSVENGNATSQGGGQFKITGSGSITIKAEASDSFDTWTFYADPKPVTAIVTAASKPYDGNNTATLTVAVSGLVSGDSIGSNSITAAGYFADTNVGTQTVVITGLTIPEGISAKYDISYPQTITATITPATASVPTPPAKIDGLTYTGQPQALVSEGTASNGNMAYSLDGISYSFTVPEGTDAKTYTVWYKAVAADKNHEDSAPVQVTAAIGVNTGTPTVTCSPATLSFDGSERTPTVIVLDSAGREIPNTEYSVELPSPRSAVGTYTVTVKDKPGGNYQFSGQITGTFEIVAASQNPLSITDKPASVHYGDTFVLSAIGGSGSGAIQWKSTNEAVATIDGNGKVTVKSVGSFTVEAYRSASGGYSQSNTDTAPFYADPKPVTAVATAVSRGYNGGKDTTVTVTVPELNATITATGTFDDENVGTGKTVTIVYGEGTKVTNSNYQITWPDSTTASLYKVDAKIETAPVAADLTYNKNAQALVTGGTTVGNIGTIVYSLSQNGTYSENIPTGTNAGTYTVWYKVADSVNYTGIPAAEVKVEIKKADLKIITNPTASAITPDQPLSASTLNGGSAQFGNVIVSGSFAWAKEVASPVNGTKYDVIFTPSGDDAANYNPATVQVAITVSSSNPGSGETPSQSYTPPASRPSTPSASSEPSAPSAVSTPTQTTVRNGTASTVLSTASGSKLVNEAAANQSQTVVIKPEITGDVTKTEVSIPASTVKQLERKTDAALTVSSPVADVTISNAALGALGSAGGNVSVVTEQVEQSVVLTLAAGGETVEQVPGGVTLAVPVEDAGPGTVAVLVHDDGTRETIRKSVVEADKMNIPLSGSATIEIVDNSKDFTDVSDENWASDAVAFASAHELFSGTSETTFSPDLPMSRGMLATVLYNLEGQPDQNSAVKFSDVSSEAWYADGVSWASANDITNGYGNGQFGPDDNITREQFAVMLWKYAGSPAPSGESLNFTDTDQANSYALEALSWAVENGVLNGYGDGRLDPGGVTTRAQAAQMLKNFMENT